MIRPPPGLGFSPRSRQPTNRLPPGFNSPPELVSSQCTRSPGGHLRPPPGFERRNSEEDWRAPVRVTDEAALGTGVLMSNVTATSPLNATRRPRKISKSVLEARRCTRRAGREAMRQEMDREDDEAREARRLRFVCEDFAAV